jgi:O-antigen/teichoic acid export membrane protein
MSPPALSDAEEQIIARERLRLLAIGFYVKGAVSAIFVSFLLFHFVFLLGFSFMPESAWNPPPRPATTIESVSVSPSPSPSPRPVNQGPPVAMFRIFAAAIGFIILLGWTFGALTIYAGRCVHKRTHRLFIFIMAGLNCALIPWGTLLGVATFYLMQSPAARREFGPLTDAAR